MSVQMSSFLIINVTFLSTTFSDSFGDWFTEVCYPLKIEACWLILIYFVYLFLLTWSSPRTLTVFSVFWCQKGNASEGTHRVPFQCIHKNSPKALVCKIRVLSGITIYCCELPPAALCEVLLVAQIHVHCSLFFSESIHAFFFPSAVFQPELHHSQGGTYSSVTKCFVNGLALLHLLFHLLFFWFVVFFSFSLMLSSLYKNADCVSGATPLVFICWAGM